MKKTLSIVIPVYNESARIQKAFNALELFSLPRGFRLDQIIFVNDGSTDSTLLKIKNWKKTQEKKIKIISYTTNKGKGYAVKQGLDCSTADYTLLLDADISTEPLEIYKFSQSMRNNADVIIGTRKSKNAQILRHQSAFRELLGKGFTFMTQILLNVWVSDFTCGFKVLSRFAKNEISTYFTINRWGYDAELIYLAKRSGYTIKEIPVVWSNDPDSKVSLLIDIPRTLTEIITIRIRHEFRIATFNAKRLSRPAYAFVVNSMRSLL